MRTTTQSRIRAAAVLLVILVLTACVQTNTPGDTSGPCIDQAQEYLKASGAILNRWQDTMDRAGSTGRIALEPVIADMQAIRREHDGLKRPACVEQSHAATQEGMSAAIDGMLAFMSQKPQSTVDGYFDRAADALARATRLMSEMNEAGSQP